MAFLILFLLFFCAASQSVVKIEDSVGWKKLLKNRRSILVAFHQSNKDLLRNDLFSTLTQAAKQAEGIGTIASVDCSLNRETKGICQKAKVTGKVELKHYQDGVFNLDYNRELVLKSIVSFLKSPSSDIPWEEDPTAKSVLHLNDGNFEKTIQAKKKTLVMFYAPWCGHCKHMKPEFAAAATELRSGKKNSNYILAGIDATDSNSRAAASKREIKGYPTLQYFEDGVYKFNFEGGRTKEDIIKFLENPAPPAPPAPPEPEWEDTDESGVVHLGDETFADFLATHPSVLVMFYAPWCGHCKAAKPKYMEAAGELKAQNVAGVLAAVNAEKHRTVAASYSVKGYPTLIYFKDGEQAFVYNGGREKQDFIDFIKDPKEEAATPAAAKEEEAKWSDEPSKVVHLTEDSFDKYFKRNKDVHALVMFYAPWCGHCKHLKPDYTLAADSAPSGLAFVAVDATLAPKLSQKYEVQGYPTLKYIHKGKTAGYDGGRSKEEMLDWMRGKAGIKEEL